MYLKKQTNKPKLFRILGKKISCAVNGERPGQQSCNITRRFFPPPSTHHVCLLVCVTGLLRCSQQWHKSSEQLVLFQLQHRQLLVSLVFLRVHFVERHLAVVHACQHITQVGQALPNIRAATL